MGFWSSLDPFSSKSVWRKAGRAIDPTYSRGAIGSVTAPVFKPIARGVKWVGREVDLTSSKSLGGLGRYVAPIARPAVATAAAAVTGGASVVLAERGAISKSAFGAKPTMEGYAVGAGVGLAVLGGKTIGQAVAGAARDSIAGGGSDTGGRAPVTGGDATATTAPGGESFLAALLAFMFPGRST